MFERYTERSKRVIILAREEAGMLNHNFIGTEHLLLGLLSEAEGVAAWAPEVAGIDIEAARRRVAEIIGRGEAATPSHIPFTPRSKQVLGLAIREAHQLGHDYIGTEHLLLALITEGNDVGVQFIGQLGADPERVRQQVLGVFA
jgi:ATP-dependent Clp protease ATP-binding subunit ClpC